MANIFSNTEPPAWLEQRAILAERNRPNWGGLIGTGLAAGLKSLTEDVPATDAEGNMVRDDLDRPVMKRKPFWQSFGEARMNQVDPLWQLKSKQVEANMQNARALVQAKWLDYDRKAQDAEWLQSSMDQLAGWNPEQEIPAGVTHPKALAAAMRQRQVTVGLQQKAQQMENNLAAAQQKLDMESQRLGIQRDTLALRDRQLDQRESQFQQKLDAATALETQRQQGRVELEKMRSLSRLDAAGRPLTKQQYINRHLNTVYKQMVTDNPDPRKPVTLRDAQESLSKAYDELPGTPAPGSTNSDPLNLFK